jgi:serine-type D-Ala-D-Ala carboxypeptidase/endopeptidase (penicillin-binding protein 4)
MKRVRVALLLAAILAPPAAIGALDRLPGAATIALRQSGVPESAIGVYVHDLSTNTPVISINADRALNPASVVKLLTTYAALDLLGPAYVWKTEAYLDGTLLGGRLQGDLILKGYGDPKLTLEALWLFLRDLRGRGLREIDGRVVLDRSHFEVGDFNPAEFDNEPNRPYNVGPDALLLNYKSVKLQFLPDEQRRRVEIFAEPQLPQVSIVNNLAIGPGNCSVWPERPSIQGNTMAFVGVYPAGCGERSRHFSLLGPDEYFGTVFRQLWRELGGTLTGAVGPGPLPPGARLFATAVSPPLSELIRDINKFSNNVMARQLFLTLAGTQAPPPLTAARANDAVRAWLSRAGMHFPELNVDNGSGLSRSGRISARNLGKLLISAWRSPLMPEFISSMPLVAVDGTMRRRLGDSPVAGQAHIKTGYLEGVRTIAGYVNDIQGRSLAVVFLINHADARNAQAAQDALLDWLYHGYPQDCCARHRE